MRQAPWILILAATAIASAAAISQARAGADPAEPDVVAQARKLIADKDLRSAAEALEDALATVSTDQRAAVVDLLRETYAKLVEDAKAAGNDREAAELAEDLAILEASPRPAAAPKTEPKTEAPKADEPAVVVPRGPQPSDSEPKPDPEPTEPPAALELPALSGPADKAAEPPAETPPSESSVEEEIPALSTTAPPPKRMAAPARADASAPVVKVPAPNPAAVELAEADAHFTRKNYGEAGKLYASLAARNSLPAERRKVWAYCRWAAVVDRINAKPRSAEEWDAIEREIDNIQTLVPGNWYGEYLKDRVIDSRKGERHAGRGAGRGLTIRGNTPEEPGRAPAFRPAPAGRPLVDDQIQRAGGEAHLDLPAPGAVPPPEPLPAPVQSPASAPPPATAAVAAAPIDWQVLETTNFRVFHVDAALAGKVAEAAEATRISQGAQWGSRAVRGAWTPRCDLYLYPTPADFARMTGQPETSPGFSTMGISGDRVTTRRVNLRADHPQLLAAILPHEVAHVVLADVFTDHQIPRWADEGMAVLAEPPAEQAGRAAELNAPLAQNQVFQLDQLMNIDFPGDEKWGLYYAQSVSLTQFFVRRGTPDQFIAFLKSAQRRGPETALREIYQIEGFADLETQWRAFAHRQASQIASAEDGIAR